MPPRRAESADSGVEAGTVATGRKRGPPKTGTDNDYEDTKGTAHVVFFRLGVRFGLLPALAFSVDLVGRATCDAQS